VFVSGREHPGRETEQQHSGVPAVLSKDISSTFAFSTYNASGGSAGVVKCAPSIDIVSPNHSQPKGVPAVRDGRNPAPFPVMSVGRVHPVRRRRVQRANKPGVGRCTSPG
jgi:hypothetical protein